VNAWTEFGFTTGMAAAAGAAAACELITSGRRLSEVVLTTPDGKMSLTIPVGAVERRGKGAVARVIKRAGPDRDITDGLTIQALVEPKQSGMIDVAAGPGVGTVTRPGLGAAVGRPAVNTAPLGHIKETVARRLPAGAAVTISAPGGEAIALKTFNPRLGIVGGISILGTSGLVRPMSAEAWKSALLPQLDQAAAMGYRAVALSPGNLGARAAVKLGWPEPAVVQTGNFVGYMVGRAAERGMDQVLVGHLGKLVKIAAGYENTHHARTPDRLALLAGLLQEIDPRAAGLMADLGSAEAAIGLLRRIAPQALGLIAERAQEQAGRMAGAGRVGVVITDLEGRPVGASSVAAGIMVDLL
jgi:cobalt-precorrin-5B (C1)-methyltransferase